MLKLFEQVYQKSLQESDDSDITSVELDICDWNDSGYEDFISSVEDYGLDWNMIEEHGPGGGNPVFELTGSKRSIRAWLLDNYCNEDELDYYMS